MSKPRFIPLPDFRSYPAAEMVARADAFQADMRRRRTVRDFSPAPVPREVIEHCLRAAGSAPSGANLQPWHFVVVSDPDIKRQIREAAEEQERAFYGGKAPAEWLEALAPLGTDAEKPYLERASYLIVIFERRHDFTPEGRKLKHYYTKESVGIATGILITALHQAGLATLTHTPNPMGFLNRILDRPASEKPFLILVVGLPASQARVPDIVKRELEDIATFR